MRQQHSFPRGLVGGLAIVCLAGAHHACQPRAPEDSDAPEEPAAEHTPEAGGGEIHWTYDGETGAARWGGLDPSFAACAEGAQQSPVDLAGPIPAGAGTLDIQWQPAEAHVVDNGHTIQVDVAEGSAITLEGRRFSLLQFHFHLPSEHAVGGSGFPMEVHFVHQAEEGDLAVVGVFLVTGESHPAIETIWGAAPGSGEPSATLPELDPRTLLPEEAGYFRYAGSLTTPPCSEVVSWVVMTEPISVSPAQAEAFAARHPMNVAPFRRSTGEVVSWVVYQAACPPSSRTTHCPTRSRRNIPRRRGRSRPGIPDERSPPFRRSNRRFIRCCSGRGPGLWTPTARLRPAGARPRGRSARCRAG